MGKPKQHLYEGMFIISSTLSDEARNKAVERLTNAFTKRGGELQKSFEQGRHKLAYEIDGKREGYYYVLYFTLPTSQMKDVWRDFHLNEDLIRFMTMKVDAIPEKLEFKTLAEV